MRRCIPPDGIAKVQEYIDIFTLPHLAGRAPNQFTHRTYCRTRSTITVPHELNYVILTNKRVMLNILFMATAQALLIFGEKPDFMATLHTWDQKLNAHYHLHCLVAGGAISKDGSCWIPRKGNYLFNQQALPLVFRGKFMNHMSRAYQGGDLKFAGDQYKQLKARLSEVLAK